MELVNKTLKAVINGVEKDIAPATRSDNVFLSTNPKESIEDSLISVYTHTKNGTTHNFQGKGSNGKVLMTADVEVGDSFAVNGQIIIAYIGTEDAANNMAGNSWSGKWITFTFDGEILNFNGGNGLTNEDKAKLIPENIRKGIKIFENTSREIIGNFEGSIAFQCAGAGQTGNNQLLTWYDYNNTSADNIIESKYIYMESEKINGTPVQIHIEEGTYICFMLAIEPQSGVTSIFSSVKDSSEKEVIKTQLFLNNSGRGAAFYLTSPTHFETGSYTLHTNRPSGWSSFGYFNFIRINN